VDGVLTDASVFIGGREEVKQFNILDGLGLVNLRRQGLKVGWISSRPSPATTRRARELKIDFLRQEKGWKVSSRKPASDGMKSAMWAMTSWIWGPSDALGWPWP
jgi:3-deoxy-D-manno-octulosonate 8-phosphate phosphatase (KDO 8-P phosphatase)